MSYRPTKLPKRKPRVVYDDEDNIIEGLDYLVRLMFLPNHHVEVDFINAPAEVVEYLKTCMKRERNEREALS